MNILIIDDDSEDTEIFCAALSEILPGAVCTVSNSCLKVHELINALPFQHFIFLDGHMTPVNGRQCLIELLRIINPLETKVIIYTGRISDEETTASHEGRNHDQNSPFGR